MILYIVRHGQTSGDLEGRYGGDYDDHLTNLGKEQAAKLAIRIKQDTEVYSKLLVSPLVRAQETAEIISKKLLIPLSTEKGMKERNGYGILTGMKKTDAKEQFSSLVDALTDPKSTIQGAEEYEHFKQRISNTLQKICKENNDNVLVVTHGGPIRIIFREILKIGEVDVSDCASIKLNYNNGTCSLIESFGISMS